jgi:hypothetical protein
LNVISESHCWNWYRESFLMKTGVSALSLFAGKLLKMDLKQKKFCTFIKVTKYLSEFNWIHWIDALLHG